MPVSYRRVGERWHIRFVKGSGKTRKEVIESLPGSLHEKSVQKKADWYEMQWSMGEYDPFQAKLKNNAPVLGDAVEEYCIANQMNGNWAESTYRTNRNRLRNLMDDHSDVQIGEQTPREFFQQLIHSAPGKAVTRKGCASTLNAFLNWLSEEGYLDTRFTVSISMHDQITLRNDDKVKYMSWDQLRDVCDAHRFIFRQSKELFNSESQYGPDFYTDMWWFYFYSLLRSTELPKLTVADLLSDGRLKVRGKGRRTDTIYLPPPARTIAEKYCFGKDPHEHIFTSHHNRSRYHFGRAVKMALGERFASTHGRKGFHQLRHGGIVHYLSLGKLIQFVSKLARHKNINITSDIYGDVINEAARDAFSDISHRPVSRPELEHQRFTGMN